MEDLVNRHRRTDPQAVVAGFLTLLVTGAATSAWAQADHGDGAHDDREHHVPLFPAAGNEHGRQGFVRIINREDAPGEVRIQAIDDTGHEAEGITLTMAAEATVHFNSDDLEDGGAAAETKGLSGHTGAPMGGDWRLEMTSGLDLEVLAFIRHADGFLTSMHDTGPSGAGRRYRVAVFNPGSNPNQVSHLRLINPGDEEAEVEIVGIDDKGTSPGDTVEVSVGEGRTVTLSAADLEGGGTDFEGALGDGQGKWQLDITSSEPIMVMSLLESANTNQLTNLSTAPTTGFESAREVFVADISAPIVQSKCINCHVAGGAAGHTPLVFVRAGGVEDHGRMNFDEFEDYLAEGAHDDEPPVGVILDKIQGNLGHGGGEQVPADTADFHNMERFLAILEDEVADQADHGDE